MLCLGHCGALLRCSVAVAVPRACPPGKHASHASRQHEEAMDAIVRFFLSADAMVRLESGSSLSRIDRFARNFECIDLLQFQARQRAHPSRQKKNLNCASTWRLAKRIAHKPYHDRIMDERARRGRAVADFIMWVWRPRNRLSMPKRFRPSASSRAKSAAYESAPCTTRSAFAAEA